MSRRERGLTHHALTPATAESVLCAAQTSGCSESPSLVGDLSFCLFAQDEGSTLLSALATALSNCRLPWPAFLPVYDPLRDAWWGIAISGLGTIHYDTDSIHSSKMPFRLQQVQAGLADCTLLFCNALLWTLWVRTVMYTLAACLLRTTA